jgi:hypothetical protein
MAAFAEDAGCTARSPSIGRWCASQVQALPVGCSTRPFQMRTHAASRGLIHASGWSGSSTRHSSGRSSGRSATPNLACTKPDPGPLRPFAARLTAPTYPGGAENRHIFDTVSRLKPNTRATSRRLRPSTNTKRRTAAYDSTTYIPRRSPLSENAYHWPAFTPPAAANRRRFSGLLLLRRLQTYRPEVTTARSGWRS